MSAPTIGLSTGGGCPPTARLEPTNVPSVSAPLEVVVVFTGKAVCLDELHAAARPIIAITERTRAIVFDGTSTSAVPLPH